jgi:hypothetical protein
MRRQPFFFHAWPAGTFAAGWLILAVFYTTRLVGTIEEWSLLSRYYLPFSLPYLLISGLFWGILSFSFFAGFVLGKKWVLVRTPPALTLFFLWIWIEHLAGAFLGGWKAQDPFFFGTSILLFVVLRWLVHSYCVELLDREDLYGEK